MVQDADIDKTQVKRLKNMYNNAELEIRSLQDKNKNLSTSNQSYMTQTQKVMQEKAALQ